MVWRKGHAFTIIELLMVISIIALLLTLLLPALNRANELARTAVCCSNLSHIGVGFNAYYTEHEQLPGTWGYWPNISPDFPKAGYPYDSWAEYLNPYLGGGGRTYGSTYQICQGTWDLISCPTDMIRNGLPPAGGPKLMPRRDFQYRCSYGMNSSLIYPNTYPPGRPHKMPTRGFPSRRVLLLDAGDSLMWYGNTKEYLSMLSGTNGFSVWSRHSYGFNVLWLDGHVEWRLKSSMTTRDMDPDLKGVPFADDAAQYNHF